MYKCCCFHTEERRKAPRGLKHGKNSARLSDEACHTTTTLEYIHSLLNCTPIYSNLVEILSYHSLTRSPACFVTVDSLDGMQHHESFSTVAPEPSMKTIIPSNAATSAIISSRILGSTCLRTYVRVTCLQGLNVITLANKVSNMGKRPGPRHGSNSTRAITLGLTQEQSPSMVSQDSCPEIHPRCKHALA